MSLQTQSDAAQPAINQPAAEQTIEIDLNDLAAAARLLASDAPVVLLNLLRFRPQADYSGRPDQAPCTGREAFYKRYMPAFNQLPDVGSRRVVWFGSVLARVVGPANEVWDDVALVEYPSFAAFRRLIESPQYQETAVFHRVAALANARLLALAPAA